MTNESLSCPFTDMKIDSSLPVFDSFSVILIGISVVWLQQLVKLDAGHVRKEMLF